MGGFGSAPMFSRVMGWTDSQYQVECVKAAGLAFFDAHVKEEKEAQAFLKQKDIPLYDYQCSCSS